MSQIAFNINQAPLIHNALAFYLQREIVPVAVDAFRPKEQRAEKNREMPDEQLQMAVMLRGSIEVMMLDIEARIAEFNAEQTELAKAPKQAEIFETAVE